MRLFEAIVEANQRSENPLTVKPVDRAIHRESLPVAALSCIDVRLNPLLPTVLGLAEEDFIWLRNAGNIIFEPMSSMLRTLALACAIKGGREIAVIGHTDCLVRKTTMLELTERFRTLGIERARLPDNLNEFFGLFASERQNVLQAAQTIRSSPLIGPQIPVHGLLLDTASGKLEWVVNGYQQLADALTALPSAPKPTTPVASVAPAPIASAEVPLLQQAASRLLDTKIGQGLVETAKWLSEVETLAKPSPEQTQRAEATARRPEVDWVQLLDKALNYRVIGTDQKVYGPITGLKLLKWIGEGRVNAATAAQVEGRTDWKPLEQWAKQAIRKHLPTPPFLGHKEK